MTEGELLRDMPEEEKKEIKQYIEKTTGHKIRDEKIDEIGIYSKSHSYQSISIELGKVLDEKIAENAREEVVAILEAEGGFYLVCTPGHGYKEGEPYIFRDQDVYRIEEEV